MKKAEFTKMFKTEIRNIKESINKNDFRNNLRDLQNKAEQKNIVVNAFDFVSSNFDRVLTVSGNETRKFKV